MLALFDYFPQSLRMALYQLPVYARDELEEIRLRCNRFLQLRLRSGTFYADKQGRLLQQSEGAFAVSKTCLDSCMEQFTASSLYAWEHELSCGYLTLEGGHRVGFCGTCVIREGRISGIRDISSINVRVARQIKGVSDELMPYLISGEQVKNTLLISPPGCGKTTMLRDIARNLSDGFGQFPGVDVAVADERGELGATCRGTVGNDLGSRTDVLDGCPKAAGMIMLLRTMCPRVLMTDEIGSREEAEAVAQALRSGVSVIASVHGRDRREVLDRMPELAKLFGLFVTLRCREGVHEIAAVEEYD